MEFTEFSEKIEKAFLDLIGMKLNEKQTQAFFEYMNLLIEKNKVMNLTAINDPDEIIVKHFVDSSILSKFYSEEFFKSKKLIDVGTGAGFPGIPLAIIYPDSKFVLTDTLGKRINFLLEVLDKIKLKNTELIKARAEDLAHDPKYREKFDICLSRGVAKISVLSEYSLPFVKEKGAMLAYKMDNCEEEFNEGSNAIKVLGGMFHVKHTYTLNPEEPKRCILQINKIKSTPKIYPRKAGTPSKAPL